MKELEAKVSHLLKEAQELKIKLGKKEQEVCISMQKANEVAKIVLKIRAYIRHPDDVINKVKLFNRELGKAGLIFRAKIITVLLDYLQKLEKIFEKMRILFTRLDPEVLRQPIPLEEMPNISINMKVLFF